MTKKLMLILNPAAGSGGGMTSIGPVLETFYRDGLLPTVFITGGPGEATGLAEQYAMGFDCVACIGGDGTLSETVAGLARLENPPPLGYIPQGTANDVAASLALPKNPVQAAKIITRGKTVLQDVGRFNGNDYFTYIAAFGAFTEVSYETPRQNKQALGHLAYVLQGVSQIPKLTDYRARVCLDGETVEGEFIFGSVSNTKSVGGIVKLKKPGIQLNDGLFEVTLVRSPTNVIEMNRIVSSILSQNFDGGQLSMFRVKSVSFEFDEPVKWTRDGEAGGAHERVAIENLQEKIRIFA